MDDGNELGPSYDVTVLDGTLSDGPHAAKVNFANVNDAPVGTDDLFTVVTGSKFNGFGLMNNDVDVDSASLTTALGSAPSNGTVTVNPDGSFVYMPNPDFTGTDSFTYLVSDGIDDSGPVTVLVNVLALASQSDTDPIVTDFKEPASSREEDDPSAKTISDEVRQKVSADLPRLERIPIGVVSSVTEGMPVESAKLTTIDLGVEAEEFIFRLEAVARTGEISQFRSSLLTNEFMDKNGWFWKALDENKQQLESDSRFSEILLGGSAAIASTVTVGYLVWLIKGGQVLAAVLANLPAWSLIDPLPILNSMTDDDDDDDSLHKIIEEGEDELKSAHPVTWQ